jgi:hypothetical protein
MEIFHQIPPAKEQLARVAVLKYHDPVIDNILEAMGRMSRAIAAIDEAQKCRMFAISEAKAYKMLQECG